MATSKSPDRHTFQSEAYIKRCEEEGKDPREDYLNLFKSARQQDEENLVNPEWQKDNLEYDLRSTDWVLEKARSRDAYAQNLYAAMCNNEFQRLDTWLLLTGQTWSCSWRSAGGIIADMLETGDYMDWYCSGIQGDPKDIDYGSAMERGMDLRNYVSESVVTDEVREDLKRLGWIVLDNPEE
jgi:hypothetical protein